ncbi:MAG TPA: isochorismatase family cysteine hydrolase [Spirochaetota bacterium]|nr:cysteine hydrolase [Spirochaetota bacterium]HOD14092.1 isochorismatase family cysteine hydrolase [Spirochaetota bacterium]HPG49528.1 isochorismatase family cysteine hydrolase [Spirochaetota bacterium]HPN11463.1 isochorismatase family cysteine hydrolase [Spirochaetota bacterium]HQL81619.1 isochorismatase family cysteine hydrolase [Spirochaetota bacterium]
MEEGRPALIVVDMQHYYLQKTSAYWAYFNALQPGCLDYIANRCETIVIPNIRLLLQVFRSSSLPPVFLRLCGKDPDRTDLHRFFRDSYTRGKRAGFDGVYPLADEPDAAVVGPIMPLPGETVIDKTTFSPFTGTGIDGILRGMGVSTLLFTGLATSQCVETTARDASDRGYRVIQVEDAQADYDEASHIHSLCSSQGVCGGHVVSTGDIIHRGVPAVEGDIR